MKALTHHTYGTADVLSIYDIATPAITETAVLVRVHAAALNYADWHYLTGTPRFMRLIVGLRRPKKPTPGFDLAGTVTAVGDRVTEFAPGDEVFGRCNRGTCAEYAAVSPQDLVLKPADATFEQASTIGTASFTALQALRDKGNLQPGQHVLIKGASGGVGTFAVQLAKEMGAQVTAVCSTRNLELVKALGADDVIDYTKDDITQRPRPEQQRYDLILDIAGTESPSACRRMLKRSGTYVLIGGPKGEWLGPIPLMLRATLLSIFVSQRFTTLNAQPNEADRRHLRDLLDSGALTPAIDRTYPLTQGAEALAYLGEGHARGKVIVVP